MGTKPVQALAGLLLVGVSLTGCQSEGGYGGAGGGAPQMIGGNTVSPMTPVGSRMTPGTQQQLSTASAMGQVGMGNGGMNMNGGANVGGVAMNATAAATPTGANMGMSFGQQQTSTSMSTPVMQNTGAPVMQPSTSSMSSQPSYTPASYSTTSQPVRPAVSGSPTSTSSSGEYYEVPKQATPSYNNQ